MPSILSTETSSDIFILNSSYLPFYQKHEMFLLNGTGNFIMIKAGSHKIIIESQIYETKNDRKREEIDNSTVISGDFSTLSASNS
jgi:hypothetical protein